MLAAHNDSCADSQHTSPSGHTPETDMSDTTMMRRSRVDSGKTVLPFDLKKSGTIFLRMASVRIAHTSRDEVMERLEQLGWEPAANVTYTLLEKKSILHELEEKATKSKMNDNLNVCADLSQKNNTELRDVCKALSTPLSGHETKPQLTRKVKEV